MAISYHFTINEIQNDYLSVHNKFYRTVNLAEITSISFAVKMKNIFFECNFLEML